MGTWRQSCGGDFLVKTYYSCVSPNIRVPFPGSNRTDIRFTTQWAPACHFEYRTDNALVAKVMQGRVVSSIAQPALSSSPPSHVWKANRPTRQHAERSRYPISDASRSKTAPQQSSHHRGISDGSILTPHRAPAAGLFRIGSPGAHYPTIQSKLRM